MSAGFETKLVAHIVRVLSISIHESRFSWGQSVTYHQGEDYVK